MLDPVHPQAPFWVPLEADQGAAWSLPLGFYNPDADGNPDTSSPYDLTGYAFLMTVRESAGKTARQLVQVTVTLADLAHGKIALALTAAQTAALPSGDYYYDLAGKQGASDPRYFIAGTFKVWPRGSRM